MTESQSPPPLETDDVKIVAAGPAADSRTELSLRASRVWWLGSVAPEFLPGLLQAADCGLLPSRDTGWEPRESMKLLQYIAAGLPVVSSDVPGLPAGVRTAGTAEEFATAIRAAVAKGRSTICSGFDVPSWSEVAARLLTIYLGAIQP